MDTVYVKGKHALLVSKRFVYEVTVCCYYENYYFIASTTMFESDIFIEKLVESYFINKHVEISSELYSAPKDFIDEEGYEQEVIPVKKPRKSKKK